MTLHSLPLLAILVLCPLANATEPTGNKSEEATAQEKSQKASDVSRVMARQALQQALENLEKSKESGDTNNTTSASTRTSGSISKEELGQLLKEALKTSEDLKSEHFYINDKEVTREQFMKEQEQACKLPESTKTARPTFSIKKISSATTKEELDVLLKDSPKIKEALKTGKGIKSSHFYINGTEVSREQFEGKSEVVNGVITGSRRTGSRTIDSKTLDQLLNKIQAEEKFTSESQELDDSSRKDIEPKPLDKASEQINGAQG